MIAHRFLALFFSTILLLPAAFAAEQKAAPGKANEVPLEDLRIFVEAFHQIRANYVSEVTDQQLIEYAITGMLSGLDPHSSYLNSKEYKELQESTSGEFSGLGLEVAMENGYLKVISPMDDTPAQKAGIRAGDLIVKIDDHAIKSMRLDESIELMRGKKGTKVTLTILREGRDKPIVLTVKRDTIVLKSVKSRLLDNEYGYLRIAQFQEMTAEDSRTQVKAMLDKSLNQMKGLVIDLRNNPGGILNAAIEISDLFLTEGVIVYTEGRTPESREKFHATAGDILNGRPIVILINSGSASASEIVAGALQDRKRALIAGTTSFGKGSVQVILPLPGEKAIKLTTARYFTPEGRSIQAEGIKPDITIEDASLTLREESIEVKEANLSKHLANEKGDKENSEEAVDDPLLEDYQLHEALNLLKAMALAQAARKP